MICKFFLLIFIAFLSGCSYLPKHLFMKDPLTANEHNNLGVSYEKEGKYELALKEYKRAFYKNDSLITPLVNIGNVYFKQGEYEEAEKYYLAVLRKDKKSIEAANNLASLYIALGTNYEKGRDYLKEAITSLETTPSYALDTFGVLHSRLGDKEKAKDILVKACEKAKHDEVLLKEIGFHLKELEYSCINK